MGATVAVAGEGEAAEAKARLFDGSPARLLRLHGEAASSAAAYAGARLAFIAGDAGFVTAAAAAARQAGCAVNVVDHPALCDFHTPAIVDRGQVVAAIGTAGAAPMLASLLRGQLEQAIGPGVGALAGLLAERRDALRRAWPDLAQRRAVLRRMLAGPAADAAAAGDLSRAGALLDAALAEPEMGGAGRLWLLARPAAADLITLRALRILAVADAAAFEAQDAPLIAAHARRDVQRLPLEPLKAMEEAASGGATVAVLSGDPAALATRLTHGGFAVETVENDR